MEFANMLKVFKDDATQQSLEENGYTTIKGYYNDEEIAALKQLYYNLHPKDEKGFFPSTFSKDKNYRETADKEIQKVGARSINQYFENIKIINGSFIVKSPGADSVMEIHQDMTLVDESRFTGINIWCPLVDLTPENGALYVLKGSHRIFPTLRGSTIPAIYDDLDTRAAIKHYAKPLYLKAGEAVVFDQSIIHFSPPNISDDIRITTNTFITHKNAVFRIAYWDKDNFGNEIEIFEQADDFMTDYEQFGNNIFDRPKIGKSLGKVPYSFPRIKPQLLHDKYGNGTVPSALQPKQTQKPDTSKNNGSLLYKFKKMIGIN